MSIHIITDSSADLSPADAKRLGVEIVSMSIQFGERSYLDGVDLEKPSSISCWPRERTVRPQPSPLLPTFSLPWRT